MKNRLRITKIFLYFYIAVALGGMVYEVLTKKANVFTDLFFYLFAAFALISLIALLCSRGGDKNEKYIRTLENRMNLWNTISYKVKGAGESAFNDLPIGVIVLDDNYTVKWCNKKADEISNNPILEKKLDDFANGHLKDFVENCEKSNNNEGTVVLFSQIYQAIFINQLRTIYLIEITDYTNLLDKYNSRTPALGYISVDNMEEALSNLDVQGKSECQGKIISTIAKWAETYGAFVRAFSDTKYILMTDYDQLRKMMENDFSILDDIKYSLRSTKTGNITLSMGIVCQDVSINELSNDAQEQLDLALNRGGDQVIVKVNGEVTFYGAKTDPIRKESKTELRFKYNQLEELIKGADKVFCTGHKFQDADAFGATVAMYNLCRALGKETFIIFNENLIDETVKRVYDDVKKFSATLSSCIITIDKALELKTNKSLLMCLDFQVTSQLMFDEKYLDQFKTIGVIDHHRKNDSKTIDKHNFYYSDPASSSCVELIFSLLEFSEADLNISGLEATWMMLGMVVDTNNFVYRTTANTFEIASILNRRQADTGRVKEYLKENIEDRKLRNDYISNYELYRDKVAIAVQKDNDNKSYLAPPILAKISDDLLSIKGIELSVTVAFSGSAEVRLSSRSLGGYNCQVLMEKLGGGGHLTAAACVIKGESIEKVVVRLKKAIDELLDVKENDTIRVIFISNYKNHSRGETYECNISEGNSLINSNHALLATTDNIRIFEQEQQEVEENMKRRLIEKETLKEELSKKPFEVYVSLDEDGHIVDAVNVKYVVNYIERNIDKKLKYRNLTFVDDVKVVALGEYDLIYKIEADNKDDEDIYVSVKIIVKEKLKRK